MFCEAVVALFLVGFISPVSGQTSTLVASTVVTVNPSATPHQTPNPAPSNTMPAVAQTPQTSTIEPATQTPTGKPSAQAKTPMASSPSSSSSLSTSASITPPAKLSCALVSFMAGRAWNASLSESMSALYNETSEEISKAVKKFFNVSGKYEDVEVSEHKYSEKDGVTFVNMKLCLVVKTSDGAFLDDVFIEKVKTGYLFEGFEVRKDSVEFKPLGVQFKDWKAKECTKCEGAGGEFTIEGTCVPKESSCQGVKNTMMTKDCVTYCGGAGTYTTSFLILAMGIFISFSFQ